MKFFLVVEEERIIQWGSQSQLLTNQNSTYYLQKNVGNSRLIFSQLTIQLFQENKFNKFLNSQLPIAYLKIFLIEISFSRRTYGNAWPMRTTHFYLRENLIKKVDQANESAQEKQTQIAQQICLFEYFIRQIKTRKIKSSREMRKSFPRQIQIKVKTREGQMNQSQIKNKKYLIIKVQKDMLRTIKMNESIKSDIIQKDQITCIFLLSFFIKCLQMHLMFCLLRSGMYQPQHLNILTFLLIFLSSSSFSSPSPINIPFLPVISLLLLNGEEKLILLTDNILAVYKKILKMLTI